jgi:2-keto-4-pentenoate hydratase
VATNSAFDPGGLTHKIDDLRESGERLPTASFGVLPDISEAEAIQKSVPLSGKVTDAWKVAKSPTGTPVVSRLHPFVEDGDSPLVWRPGTSLEIEVAVQLAHGLPPGWEYHRNDILGSVGQFFLGAELVRSVALEGGKVSFPLFLADRMGNDGYFRGPVFSADSLDHVQTSDLTIELGNETIFHSKAKHNNGDCLGWLVDFANLRSRDEDSLRRGSIITTGSLCGAIELTKPGLVRVTVAPEISFEFSIL